MPARSGGDCYTSWDPSELSSCFFTSSRPRKAVWRTYAVQRCQASARGHRTRGERTSISEPHRTGGERPQQVCRLLAIVSHAQLCTPLHQPTSRTYHLSPSVRRAATAMSSRSCTAQSRFCGHASTLARRRGYERSLEKRWQGFLSVGDRSTTLLTSQRSACSAVRSPPAMASMRRKPIR